MILVTVEGNEIDLPNLADPIQPQLYQDQVNDLFYVVV